ncbi:MAG: NAD(P)/FAD-dependent oxidoreductase, partial [Limnobacter sp.]|nr:NAD(P)/FAD-dependent oxidoreductase [Limnobacter sp.]
MTKMKTSRVTVTEKIHDTLIIGAGFGGLGMAIKLKEAGLSNFVILERANEVGGTWRDNQYPGAACDIPSNLYSFSFAPNPNWNSSYSGSKEIQSYIKHLVKEFRLRRHIQFDQTVCDASLDETQGVWQVETSHGTVWKARTVVMASGALSNAKYPDIRGLDTFKGKKLHSSQWDHRYNLKGKRVGVIGTGASAIQIIPNIVDKVDKLKVFQRTPAWVMPRLDFKRPAWAKLLFDKLPVTQRVTREGLYWAHEAMALAVIWDSPLRKIAQRLSLQMLKTQVKDRWMRRQLKPDFKIGCKRVLVSNDYYPALQKPNAELITWPIASICEQGIKTAEGLVHECDAIVFATGFDVPKSGTPYPVRGLNGKLL